jgi:hypothetical protein
MALHLGIASYATAQNTPKLTALFNRGYLTNINIVKM